MGITPKTYNQANLLLEAIAVGDKIISDSTKLDQQTKTLMLGLNSYSKNYLNDGLSNDKLTAYEVKSLESEFFKYWKEAVSHDVEAFWEELTSINIAYQRKSPIRDLLSKGRLRHVEQWIGLFNDFGELGQNEYLTKQFSRKEIKSVTELLKSEEKKRFELVNRCFQKKEIPFSQYLKFGESMAFLERCNLMMKYFSEKEREEIYEIWESTK